MKLTDEEQRKLIDQANKENTYICGADGKLCGLPRETKVFPCNACERNKNWRQTTG